MTGRPPRGVARVLSLLLPAGQRDATLGDLEEMFGVRVAREGLLRASLWYGWQAAMIPFWLWGEEGTAMVGQMIREARFAWRGFSRQPGFTATTVLTLAVGIGAVTAVFSVVNGVLLTPLSHHDSGRLVDVQYTGPGVGLDLFPSSVNTYLMSRESSRFLEAVALYSTGNGNLTGDGTPRRVPTARVTPSLFVTLGLEPAMGRAFTEEEGLPDTAPVAVLSNQAWVEAMGSDSGVIGQSIHLDGVAREIVGVLPPGVDYPFRSSWIWIPLRVDPNTTEFGGFNHFSIARLAPGATPSSAASELDAQLPVVAERFEGLDVAMLESARISSVVVPLSDRVVGEVRTALWILLGTVGFVLLIACGNVANLLMARAEGRQREMAIRVALGADRQSLFGRALAESAVLALLGGVGGLVLAGLGIATLRRTAPTGLPRLEQVGLDPLVLAVTGLVVAGVAVVFGMVPLARRGEGSRALREGGRGATGGRRRHRARQVLVAGQVALALMLLVGSGLMVRSFQSLLDMDPGFQSTDVVLFDLALPWTEYGDAGAMTELHHRFLDRLEALPGVDRAGLVTRVPLTGLYGLNPVATRDTPIDDPGYMPPLVSLRAVTPGYFEVMGIPLLEGRALRRGDAADRSGATLFSRRAAEAYWGERQAVGQEVSGFQSDATGWSTVVGVVGDVPYLSLTEPPMGAVYYPLQQAEDAEQFDWLSQSVTYTLKTSLPHQSMVGLIRAALAELDPTLPIANLATMDALVARARSEMAFTMTMLGLAAAVGLLLGVVGLYGVISYVTTQRTREIGVRIALGAAASSVRGMVMRQGLGVVAVGAAAGLAGSLLMTRFMRSVLYDVDATDPLTMAGVTLLLVAVSALAIWIPARRAAGTDPMKALRAE